MRGADTDDIDMMVIDEGPSPHARGRPLPVWTGRVLSRTIPACAGPTPRPRTTRRALRDHPRMRGADAS